MGPILMPGAARRRQILSALACCVGALWWPGCAASASAGSPVPAHVVLTGLRDEPDMAFDHYTFAAMWLPGLCRTWSDIPELCAQEHGQPVMRRFTLHGLWPSRPQSLIRQGVPAPIWWQQGCSRFEATPPPSGACDLPPLDLSPTVRRWLDQDMPLTRVCLDRHEYSKHVACFGPSAQQFFPAALDLLDALNDSSFARWMAAHAGRVVSRAAIEHAYARSFDLPDASSLQLECESKAKGAARDVLTQVWITIPSGRLAEFPAPAAFSTGRQGDCTARIRIAAGG